MKRDKITLSKDFMEAIQNVPDSRAYKRIMSAVLKYAFDGEETDLTGVEEVIFRLAKSSIDRNNKRFLNGCKGGRKTTKLEPNSNLTITKPEPNPNQTITKLEPNCNQIITENQKEKEEKEKEKENSPIKENPPTPLKENIYPQEIKEKVKEEKEYISPRVGAYIEPENFGINDFLSAHNGVKIDGYSGEISCIDWKLLHEKFIDSGGWLDENFKALSVIVKKYQTIITGQYDKKRKARRETTNDVLDRMLREEYARQKQ